MTNDVESDTDLQRLPKVELHLHLDCSLSYLLFLISISPSALKNFGAILLRLPDAAI